ALSADEYRHVDWSNLEYLLADAHHLRTGGEKAKVFRHLIAVVAKRLVLRGELFLLARLQHRRVQLGLLERLSEVVVGSDADRFHHRANFIRTGKHDDVQAAVRLHQFLQSLNSIQLGHENVENDEVRAVSAVHFGDGFSSGADRLDVVSVDFQQRLQILSDARLVIDHQNS